VITAQVPKAPLQGTANEVRTAANGAQENIQYLSSITSGLGGPLYYNHYAVG
jgi:hypothetical protein